MYKISHFKLGFNKRKFLKKNVLFCRFDSFYVNFLFTNFIRFYKSPAIVMLWLFCILYSITLFLRSMRGEQKKFRSSYYFIIVLFVLYCNQHTLYLFLEHGIPGNSYDIDISQYLILKHVERKHENFRLLSFLSVFCYKFKFYLYH